MKSFSHMRWVVLVLLALAFGGGRMVAAPAVSPPISVTAYNTTTNLGTTNVYFTNSPITTVITVTTTNYYFDTYTYVTNEFSEPIDFESVVEGTNVTEVYEGNNVYVFSLFNNGLTNTTTQFAFSWVPVTAGTITDLIQAGIPDASDFFTNIASTELVITNIYGGSSALAVSNYIISQACFTNEWVITNDYVTYGVIVTNMGPQAAASVFVTNQLPASFQIISASAGYAAYGSNLVFNVGTLADGASAQFQLTVAPTNNGVYSLVDVLSTQTAYNANPSNEVASTTLYVTNYLNDGTLVAGTNATYHQTVNPQNGLIEQIIEVTNTSGNTAQAVRLILTGLTNQLYNASGTNNGHPFVTYPFPLAVNTHVNLRLQYNPRLPFAFTNGQLQVYEVPATTLNYTPFPATSTTKGPNIDFLKPVTDSFTNADLLLEFTNSGGSSFTIVYSTNANFSNPMIVKPAISSSANRIQWEDFGPPATATAPTQGARFYRVMAHP